MASAQERIWLEQYLQCWNATEAARRAGYRWPNKIGPTKLDKFDVEIKERLDRMVMTADEALVRLSEIARGDWSKYINEAGNVEISRMVQEGKAHLISKIRDTRDGRVYEFCDMQHAIEKIGETHGLFVNRHEIKGDLVVRVIGGVDLDAV
jgi:phage terminase small subunit